MDLVYTFRYDRRSWNNQLIYSLRSAEKHLKGIDKVYVIGFTPKLRNLIHIEHTDIFSPAKNILKKLLRMADTKELSKDFIYMADDHFLTEDVEAASYPYYSNGLLSELLETQKNGYRMIIKNTIKGLPPGKPARNYNIHCPIVYNKDRIKELAAAYGNFNEPLGYLAKSLYCNHFDLYQGKELKDCKIRQNFNLEDIDRRVDGRGVFSTGKENECPNIMTFLKLKFPDKSSFEN